MELTRHISSLSVSFMIISTILSVVVPIAAIIFMAVKKRLNWKAMLFGTLFFLVFVMVLENIMHYFVIGADVSKSVVYKNLPIYVIYGGFAAGIFEETARFLCFRFILKVNRESTVYTGISYGLGHGGIEAMIIGLAAIGNLVTSVMVNRGLFDSLTVSMNEQQLEAFNKGINELINAPSYMFLISGVERVMALALQIALSLLVFKAVRYKKWKYISYAVLIHAGIDMIAVLFQRGVITNIFLLEGIILLLTAAVVYAVFRIYRTKPSEGEILNE